MDNVFALANHTLGFGIENLTLSGTDNPNGNDENNTIIGNIGNNILYGGQGADVMYGNDGSDSYYVDNSGDVVVEPDHPWSTWGGVDSIFASTSINALSYGVENLYLIGPSALNGTGNENNNIIIGNEYANVLDGGNSGTDTLNGGDGDDTYYVYDFWMGLAFLDDVIEETHNDIQGGFDTVCYKLGYGIEKLVLEEPATNFWDEMDGIGNENNNIIIGNRINNSLDGGIGADTLIGGDGNDNYIIDNIGDVAQEDTNSSSGGTDTINASVSYALGFGIEDLVLTGGANLNGTGNEYNNYIKGNSGANILNGGLGVDTMDDSYGNDTYCVDSFSDVVKEWWLFYDEGGGRYNLCFSQLRFRLWD